MAVIIVNRFVIKPVLAPPTKHEQLVGDPDPALSNALDRQHNWQMDQAPPSAGDQYWIRYDRSNNVQMVGLDYVPAGTNHFTVRADDTPYPIRRSARACAIDNLNSELEVRG